jgi:hypothetical protein
MSVRTESSGNPLLSFIYLYYYNIKFGGIWLGGGVEKGKGKGGG